MKKRGLSFLFALITGGVFLACGSSETTNAEAASSEPVKIGVVGAHSGDLASYGVPTLRAVKMVVDEWNQTGGINGRMIEIVEGDDQCTPNMAANAANKVIGEKVAAIIGPICSGATLAAVNQYLDAELAMISPSATTPELTRSGDYPNFFRTIAPDDDQAATDVDFVLNTLKLTKIAILHDNQDYGKNFATFCREAIEADGRAEVLLFEGITANALDYTAILNKVEQSGAEIIIFGGYHPEASKLVQQMRKMDLNIEFISDDGVKTDEFIKLAGAEVAEGVYASSSVDTSGNAVYQKAVEQHKAAYEGEEPGPFFKEGYAAILALLNAIKVSDSTDYQSIRQGLMNNKVETSLGEISFDQKGDATGLGFAVYQVRDGKYVEVK